MLELEIPSGAAACFTNLQDLKSALYLLGFELDMKKVQNDLSEKRFFSIVVKNTDDVFEELTIKYVD